MAHDAGRHQRGDPVNATVATAPPYAEAAEALNVARELATAGIPIFLARPATVDGQWVPDGGHNHCGYWLPNGWDSTVADPTVADQWRPGMALCMVGGHGIDGVDVDPRNGGDKTAGEMQAAGCWPQSLGRQETPSGGWHDLVNSLDVDSRDNTAPGVDVKAGRADGKGRGFLFLAPTLKLSKATGEIGSYRWTATPNLDELDPNDGSGDVLAARIRALRAPQTDDGPDLPHTAYDDMTEQKKAAVDRWLAGVIRSIGDELAAAATWPDGHRDPYDRGWQKVLADACCRFGRLARADWTPWSYVEARAALDAIVPNAINIAVGFGGTWDAQKDRRDPARWPATLDDEQAPLERLAVPTGHREASTTVAAMVPDAVRKLVLTSAAEIKPRPVFWLWAGRLALGTLSLLAGREGLGKSTLGYWMAARVTRGELPGEYFGTPKGVLVCATEDSWEHTIVPRLMASDADLSRVYRVEVVNALDVHVGLSLPRDLIAMEQASRDVDAALLLLDPLMSRLGDLDTHRDAEVRQALEPLAAIADRRHMAILGLIHHNKSGSSDPLQLVMGSKAFTAVARSVHTVVADPDDDTDTRRLFGTPKNNLGRADLPTLSFTIQSHAIATDEGAAWTGQLEWGNEQSSSIGEAMRRANVSDEDKWLFTVEGVAGGGASVAG